MAGDWIKMRMDLGDDPSVISMALAMDKSEDEIVGKLHRLWSWADRHATDGFAAGITSRWVDRFVSCTDFSKAMESAGWIEFSNAGVTFPKFDKHNGKSAKTRCDASARQRLSREERDKSVTGEARSTIPRPFRAAVLIRDKYRCAYCGTQSSDEKEQSKKALLSVDHVIPASRGGRSSLCNLLTCCKLCNNEKNDRTPEEWGILPTFLSNDVAYLSQKICDKSATREEKRREEKRLKDSINGSPPLCTIDQAKTYAPSVRFTEAEAEKWWHTRNASGWTKGSANGGNARPITSWQSDMATSSSWVKQASGYGAKAKPQNFAGIVENLEIPV